MTDITTPKPYWVDQKTYDTAIKDINVAVKSGNSAGAYKAAQALLPPDFNNTSRTKISKEFSGTNIPKVLGPKTVNASSLDDYKKQVLPVIMFIESTVLSEAIKNNPNPSTLSPKYAPLEPSLIKEAVGKFSGTAKNNITLISDYKTNRAGGRYEVDPETGKAVSSDVQSEIDKFKTKTPLTWVDAESGKTYAYYGSLGKAIYEAQSKATKTAAIPFDINGKQYYSNDYVDSKGNKQEGWFTQFNKKSDAEKDAEYNSWATLAKSAGLNVKADEIKTNYTQIATEAFSLYSTTKASNPAYTLDQAKKDTVKKYYKATSDGNNEASRQKAQNTNQAKVALKQFFADNGLTISDATLSKHANNVGYGTDTVDKVKDYYRTKVLTSWYPQYAEDFKRGMDLSDIASPYVEQMATVLEINPKNITVRDAAIQKALKGATDEKGKKAGFNLGDFEDELKRDERWQYTKNAKKDLTNVADQIRSMFGM